MKQKLFIIIAALLIFVLLGGILISYRVTASKIKESLKLGNIYLLEGKYEEAILSFEDTIKIKPKNIEARIGLANAFIGLDKKQEAEKVLKEAISIDEKKPEPYLVLAELYVNQSKVEEAISILERAYEKTKNEAVKKVLDKVKAELPTNVSPNQTSTKDLKLTIKTEQVEKIDNTADFYMYGLNEKGEKIWTQKWSDLQIAQYEIASEYTIYNNIVIIEVYANLYGINLLDGKILWKVDGTGSCAHAPVVDPADGTIYVSGYEQPFITAVNADGSIKWRKGSPSNDVYWPISIELKGEQVIVKTEEEYSCTYDKKGNLIKVELSSSGSNPPAVDSTSNFNGVIVKTVTASSYLKQKSIVHYPERICDNDNSTAWVEGAPEDGIGEFVQLNFNLDSLVSSVSLINGYAKSDYLYYVNNRVKKVKLSFSDGSSKVFNLQDDRMDYQTITLDKAVNTNYIRLTILEVYKGTKYTDTCISGVRIN